MTIGSALPQPAAIGTPGASAPDTSRLNTRENLKAASEKFEAVFIGMMLKSMRQAKLGEDILGSSSMDTFRELQDQKTAASMAATMPLGIGAALTRFLDKGVPALTDAQPESSTADAKGVDRHTT